MRFFQENIFFLFFLNTSDSKSQTSKIFLVFLIHLKSKLSAIIIFFRFFSVYWFQQIIHIIQIKSLVENSIQSTARIEFSKSVSLNHQYFTRRVQSYKQTKTLNDMYFSNISFFTLNIQTKFYIVPKFVNLTRTEEWSCKIILHLVSM